MRKKHFFAKSGKQGLCILLSVLLVFSAAGMSLAYAGQTKSQVQGELDDVNDQKEEVSNELAQVEKDIKSLSARVDSLSAAIRATADEIAATEKKIKKKEKDMQEREDGLNERLRAMYKNGSVGFLDVLLGSSSISEFVSNVEMIRRIYENDVDVMETLEKEHKQLESIKKELKVKKQSMAAQKEELAADQESLDSKKSELEKKEDELLAQAKELEQTLKNMVDVNSEYVGGVFTWPVPSSHYITSYAGYRMHPVYNVWKYHSGMDIAASYGADIVAMGDGKVIMSQSYGGYGNCVMIDHGGGIVSLYGHASSLCVSVGQSVKKGQVIAKVGSTGTSTGNHLHVEVRENGAIVDPLNYLKG